MQQAIVAKIVKFLEDCANPLPHFNYNEPKFLRNPNTFRNDFKTVFEFVFRYIQPSFQIIKLDDDVNDPCLFNELINLGTENNEQSWLSIQSEAEYIATNLK